MSVLQYVGARYVPVFYNNTNGDWEWERGVYYEPMTIVRYGSNTYISKAPVPASIGTPNDNLDYWAQTGDYNGTILEIQEQLQAALESVKAVESHMDTDEWRNSPNHIVVMGDSWADTAADPNVYFQNVLADELQATVHTYAKSGSGFDVVGGYDDQVLLMQNDTSYDKSLISAIILVAGLNEYNPKTPASQFAVKLADWVDKVRKVTSAPIYWFYDYSMINETRDNNYSTNFYDQWAYFKTIRRQVKRNIHCINMQGWVQFSEDVNNWNTSNWFHPKTEGSRDIGLNMVNIIKGLPPKIYEYAFARGEADGKTVNFAFYISGDRLLCRIHCASAIFNGAATTDRHLLTYSHALPAMPRGNVQIGIHGNFNNGKINAQKVNSDTIFDGAWYTDGVPTVNIEA